MRNRLGKILKKKFKTKNFKKGALGGGGGVK